jgi:hypothetical protein
MTQKEHQAEQIRKLAAGEADRVKILAEGEAKAIVIRAEAEAEARVVKAKADAEALKLVGEALTLRPDLLTYEYISKLSPSIRTMLVPNNTPYILPLPTMPAEEIGPTLASTQSLTSTLPFTVPTLEIPSTDLGITPTPSATGTPSPESTP